MQFVLGFGCGVLFSTVIFGMIMTYLHKEKENENTEQEKQREWEIYKAAFFAPQARILLVDDSRLSRRVIRELLEQTQIVIEEAENGAGCLAKVKKEHYDLILLDQMMPDLNGEETYRRIREEENLCRDCPVILLGANIREENRDVYTAKGFAGTIGKPIQGKQLEEMVIRLLPEHKVVQKPEGFSYENGLKYFDGNEEVYRETLLLFANLWEERQEMLQMLLEQDNMKDYAILIHAVKGDARTLGADYLAKLASDQEQLAKAGKTDEVRKGFDRVIKTAGKTAEYFKRAFALHDKT
ncbi:MAG: response regulator [Lachnospiraceae bacterium]|nr:response regulator [Lachnospiraceae bacterium]